MKNIAGFSFGVGRPLGAATTVFRKMSADLRGGEAKVPCGPCNACCRSGYRIELTAEEADRLPHVRGEEGKPELPRREDGSCALLVEGKCSVYEKRPRVCRRYDCRAMALAGVASQDLLDVGFVPFVVCNKTREDKVLSIAMNMAALKAMYEGASIDAAAAEALALWPMYREAAEEVVRAVMANPEAVAKFKKFGDQIVARVKETGERVFFKAKNP